MTTAAHTTPRVLTAYLRRATWGLPEARRQELWDELEEHLLTRADHLMLTGLTPTQATAQAIRELGPPARVTLGMAQVYTMPKLILTAATLALGISAGLYALAGGSGPAVHISVVKGTLPQPICQQGKVPQEKIASIVSQDSTTCYIPTSSADLLPGAYVSEATVRTLAESLGLQVTMRPDGWMNVADREGRMSFSSRAASVQNGLRYFDVTNIPHVLRIASPVIFSGFDHPVVRTDKTAYDLSPASGADVYGSFSTVFWQMVDRVSNLTVSLDARYTHVIRTDQPEGEVVMLTSSRDQKYAFNFAEVKKDGIITIRSAEQKLRWTSDPKKLEGQGNTGRPQAVLMRVSNVPLNTLKSGIFVPAQATSDAR
ncbi:permease prefix domain 1-containing protein [Deinococcus radiotolerans]|uniref:Uncharacterized protein n=1 Tax=Deinococcus radiotolerans TaxID=1309407 RepID=A0ABQ2FMU9_9DEIO|nr:permease prefix domain 1-containing protein [Deinococcus radiotolerans]GGL06475.1 hypothetical protein GCM10010844_26570 [Deinococcus radiotolerans]